MTQQYSRIQDGEFLICSNTSFYISTSRRPNLMPFFVTFRFPLDKTDIPTGDELKLLESQVGGADALQAPANWDDIVDPTVVQLQELKKGDQEYENIVRAFIQHSSLQDSRRQSKLYPFNEFRT